MDFTQSEVRLIQRRRTLLHRVLRYTWRTVSTFSVVVLVMYGVFVYGKLKEQLAYQDAINALPTSTHIGGSPVFTTFVDQYKNGSTIGQSEESQLVASQMQLYRKSLDSLGLSSKVLGFTLAITVVPFHSQGVRRCTNQLGVYSTDCGCERDSLDYTVLVIDSSGRNAVVTTSQLVSTASIQP
ncbi:MAG: hypothetical protein AAB424_03140 [Patescibacteria group bacterium]